MDGITYPAFNTTYWNSPFYTYPAYQAPAAASQTTPAAKNSEHVSTWEELVEQARLEADKKKVLEELDLEKAKKESEVTKKKIEKSEKPDGSSSIRVSYKESGFWGKAGRWLLNAGTSLLNLGKSVLGFEADGSWNWKKFLLNAGLTALCFVPVVGPILRVGLGIAGAALGAYNVVKGASELSKAETDEEIDQAQQDICSGTIIAVLSAIGLKSSFSNAAAAGTASAETSAASGAAAAETGAAASGSTAAAGVAETAQTSLLSKIGSWFSRPFKAAAKDVEADKALIEEKGGGAKGFFKAAGSKYADAWTNFNSWKARYNKQQSELQASLDGKLNTINSRMAELNNIPQRHWTLAQKQELAMLREEQRFLLKNQQEFNKYFGTTTKAKTEYDGLQTENSGTGNIKNVLSRGERLQHPDRLSNVKMDSKQLAAFYKRILKDQKKYAKSLKELIQTKENVMRTLAKNPDGNRRVLNAYVPSRSAAKKWYKPATWRQNEYQLAIGGKNPGKTIELLGLTATAPSVVTSAGINRLYGEEPYSLPFMFGTKFSPEETQAQLQALDEQISQYDIVSDAIKNASTRAELDAVIAQLKN